MEETLLAAVANIGVPAVIALYVLIRVNSSLDKLTAAIVKLDAKIDALTAHAPHDPMIDFARFRAKSST